MSQGLSDIEEIQPVTDATATFWSSVRGASDSRSRAVKSTIACAKNLSISACLHVRMTAPAWVKWPIRHDYSACLCPLMSTNSLQTTLALINEHRYGDRDLDTSLFPHVIYMDVFQNDPSIHFLADPALFSQTLQVRGHPIHPALGFTCTFAWLV